MTEIGTQRGAIVELNLSKGSPTMVTVFDINADLKPQIYPQSSTEPMPLSSRLRNAGRALQRARERHVVRRGEIGDLLSKNAAVIESFESGDTPLSLPRVLKAAEIFINEEDPDMRELRGLVEEEKWIKTLTQPGMTLSRAIQLLRLNKSQTKVDFAQSSGVSEGQLRRIEKGKKTRPSTLNLIINASGLEPNGMPAQLVRLLGENRLPMELAELKTCTFGELYRYLRQLRGLSPADVGRQLTPRTLAGSILHMEQSRTTNNQDGKNKLVDILLLNPKSVLAEIVQAKIQTSEKPIPINLLNRVFTGEYDGKFIFAENIQEIEAAKEPIPIGLLKELEVKKLRLIRAGDTYKILGELLNHLREKQGLSKNSSVQYIAPEQIRRAEQGLLVPNDQTLNRILKGLGYDIHSPITWYMLEIAGMLE